MSETYFPRQTCQMKMEREETLVTSLLEHRLPARAALGSDPAWFRANTT